MTKTEVLIAISTELVIPNCWAICSVAGATIEEDTGLMKVNAETMAVAAHFRVNTQLQISINLNRLTSRKIRPYFFGFSGSSGPSQSTINTSSSNSCAAWSVFTSESCLAGDSASFKFRVGDSELNRFSCTRSHITESRDIES